MTGRFLRNAKGLVTLLLVASLVGCITADRRIFEPVESPTVRIPPLQIHIADPNLGFGSRYGLVPVAPAARVEEARLLIETDMHRNLFADSSGREEYGHLLLRIERRPNRENFLWMAPCIASACLSALVGVPISSSTIELTLHAEIRSYDDVTIARYRADSADTQYAALYWGRGSARAEWSAANQTAYARALSSALHQIKDEIRQDASKISAALRTRPRGS